MKRFFFLLLLLFQMPYANGSFVTQTNIFNGEVTSNLTKGAPIAVGPSGAVTTGLNYIELTATSTTTTTSTSDGVMNSMTTTPVAGTYLVEFSTWCTESQGNQSITFSLYNNGSQKSDSVRSIIPFVGALSAITQDMVASINAVITTTGSGPVAIEWHVTAGTGSCTQRTMDLIRIQ